MLAASRMPVDSPTQRRIRSEENIARTFESGRRKPEWVWGVRRSDAEETLGLLGLFVTPDGIRLLDVFDLPPDPHAAEALVVHVTGAVAGHEAEALLFAPPGTTVDDQSVACVVRPLRAAGWELLVERRHYEFEPPAGFVADTSTALRLEQLSDPDDPRLVACHREVMRETLDAHDTDAITRLGFDAACVASLRYLVTADPVERIHLAYDERGDVVGMVSGDAPTNGRAAVLFVGVGRDHRGQGYGRQLLAWQTRRLLADGATTLIADTDNANVPMARAFADVGWPQTETRIDLVLRGRPAASV
jgi:GNAT superfamily N-acetyltransferase